MGDLLAEARRTLTWDQGSEMACHDQVAEVFVDGVFFAYPARPWERPLNGNTNGLQRQYFPKRTDLRIHSAADLRAVERRLNERPRTVLGWRTPAAPSPPAYARSHLSIATADRIRPRIWPARGRSYFHPR